MDVNGEFRIKCNKLLHKNQKVPFVTHQEFLKIKVQEETTGLLEDEEEMTFLRQPSFLPALKGTLSAFCLPWR